MRRFVFACAALWGRAAGRGSVVALLDFILLAVSGYLGYAIRLSLFLPSLYATDCLRVMAVLPGITVVVFAVFGQYKMLWRQAGLEDYIRFFWLYVVSCLLFLLANSVWRFALFPRSALAVALTLGLLLCGALRVSWRLRLIDRGESGGNRHPVQALIVGAGEAGADLARDLMRHDSPLVPAAFVDDDPRKVGKRVAGLQVLGDTSKLAEIVKDGGYKIVLIAIPSANGGKIRALYDRLAPLGVEVRLLPNLRELAGGQVSVTRLRHVRLEDLLGRDPVSIGLDEKSNYIRGRRVLITGAGGSIGSEIVRQVLRNGPNELILLGHGEQSIYLLLESLNGICSNVTLHPVIADVADAVAVEDVFSHFRPELVFHAAAHKHVPLMEFSPREALRVNGIGTRTIARAAGRHGALRMVLISTDKAVNPSSVMGAAKRVAEKVLEQEQRNFPNTAYMAVRFGNVLGSRGSVVPKFENQIAAGGPVTVTAPQMKRYFMLIPEAVSLVIQAGAMGRGGELFVLDMGDPVSIAEMAEMLIRLHGFEPGRDIRIEFTGIRPGEKLEEELFYDPASVHPTSNPKIFTGALGSPGHETPASGIDSMLETAVSEPARALELLHKMVPEYTAGPRAL